MTIKKYADKELSRLIKEGKDVPAYDRVGYSISAVHNHLTEMMSGTSFTWANHGKIWEIDHIFPKSGFDYSQIGDEIFFACWGTGNLQPLSVAENNKKKASLGSEQETIKFWLNNNHLGKKLNAKILKMGSASDRNIWVRRIIGSLYQHKIPKKKIFAFLTHSQISSFLPGPPGEGFNPITIRDAVINIFAMNEEKEGRKVNTEWFNKKFKVANGYKRITGSLD